MYTLGVWVLPHAHYFLLSIAEAISHEAFRELKCIILDSAELRCVIAFVNGITARVVSMELNQCAAFAVSWRGWVADCALRMDKTSS